MNEEALRNGGRVSPPGYHGNNNPSKPQQTYIVAGPRNTNGTLNRNSVGHGSDNQVEVKVVRENVANEQRERRRWRLLDWCDAHWVPVSAFICGCISVFLLITCLASTVWLETAEGKYRLGLWQRCVDQGVEEPLPYGHPTNHGCFYHTDPPAWLLVTAVFACSCGLTALVAALVTGVGLATAETRLKYRSYRVAMYTMFVGVVFMLIALVVFPCMFSQEVASLGQKRWEFGWAYGVAWGAAIFLFGAAILLLLDKESEEVYFRERTVHNSVQDDSA